MFWQHGCSLRKLPSEKGFLLFGMFMFHCKLTHFLIFFRGVEGPIYIIRPKWKFDAITSYINKTCSLGWCKYVHDNLSIPLCHWSMDCIHQTDYHHWLCLRLVLYQWKNACCKAGSRSETEPKTVPELEFQPKLNPNEYSWKGTLNAN